MKIRKVVSWSGMLALLLAAPGCALAQAVGAIVGTVTDSTGAVIPHARITAVRQETGIAQSTDTSDAGSYVLPRLEVGTYTVRAESKAFAPNSIANLKLDVSQQREVDFKLSPAGATETAQVSASMELINATNASLAGLVSEGQVETLPLNGRSIQNLVMLQPGMNQNTGGMGWLSPMWISNGNRGETAQATLDGSDATDAEMGTVQFWNFNLDAIAEFKVLQGNYSSEFGQGGGTITQMVTKSGTNQFHGSAFEFIRNSVFDAANYFSSSGVSPFQRNEFGVTFGGPIFRDKTFFFGEYAGFRQRLGEPTLMEVPTADQRSGVIMINGYHYQVPLNSVAKDVLSRYPSPNDVTGLYGDQTYSELYKQPTDVNQFSIRIDHKISDKDSVFGRASYINNSQKATDAVAAIEDPSFSSENMNNPRNFALSETHLFSQSLVNTLTFTVNRQIEGSAAPSQKYTQTTTADGTLSGWGPDTFATKYAETYYIASNKVSWNKGRQLLTLGGEYRYGQDDGWGVTGAGPNGIFTFNPGTPLTVDIPSTDGGPTITAGTASPSGLVSLMAGDAATYKRSTTMPGYGPAGGGYGIFGMRVWHLAGFVQDDIKFTPKLVINAGVRYEYNSVPYEIQNRLGGIKDEGDLYGHFVLNPQPIYNADHRGVAPRLGIAYHAWPKTILRGGVAVFTNAIPIVYADQAAVNFPMASFSITNSPTYSLTPLAVSAPTLTSTNGEALPPSGGTKKLAANIPVNLQPVANAIGTIIGDWASDKLKNGYTVTGNFTIEQQLPLDMALQVSYVTNHGLDLYQSSYPNSYAGAQTQYTPFTNVTPGLGEIQMFYNKAVSHYNSLQTQLRKISPLHGVQFQANYTWAKNLTNADEVWSAPGASGAISLNDPTCIDCEYARASYDVAQRFAANFSYDFPGRWGRVPKMISQGWQVLGIYSAQTGFPFTISGLYGTYNFGYDSLNGVGARPFIGEKTTRDLHHRAQYFSDEVINDVTNNTQTYFKMPTVWSDAAGTTVQTGPGNLSRNTFTGLSWWNADVSMAKDTQLAEMLKMQFRAEFFNIFNHPTFGTPSGTLATGSSNFGLATSTQSSERQMQFALRFMF